mgnify:CR=1 FL=1
MSSEAAVDRSNRSLEDLARWAFGELGKRDLRAADDIWAQDAVDHFPTGDVVGRDGIVAYFRDMFASFPDIEIEVQNVVEAEPYVVVQWRAAATFTGSPFQGVRATGRPVEFRGCDVVLINDDRLVERNTIYWDGSALARQIGLLPREGTAIDRAMLAAFNALTWMRTLGGRRLRGARR